MGVDVAIFSTRRPAPNATEHAFAASAAAETHYLFPPRLTAAMSLALAPLGTAAAMAYVAGLNESNLKQRARTAALLPCAAELVRACRRRGVMHIHSHSCADAAHVVAMARILGGPSYSLHLHGDLPVYGRDHAATMKRASCIATDGPHLVDQIVQKVGYPKARILANWMGLDTEYFAPAEPRTARAGHLHLVTVARLDACKGHRFAIEAVARATRAGADIRYTLAGEGRERANLQRQIGELGLGDRVTLLGTCGEQRVRALLHEADAFVLPSVGLGEAGPISLMEAMSAGLPAICSIIGATPDMMSDGVEGFLTPQGDVEKLTDAILRLANDPAARLRMGDAAQVRAGKQFDRSATVSRLLGFIEKNSDIQVQRDAAQSDLEPEAALA